MRTLQFRRKAEPSEVGELERQQLRSYASAVRDEQHWQDILAAAPSDTHRAELERIIGPMLPFRRAAVCTTPDCGSGKVGMWQPVLVLRNPFDSEPAAWVPIELSLCDDCKADAMVEDFLLPGVWEQVMAQWNPELGPPVRHLTTLTFDRVH